MNTNQTSSNSLHPPVIAGDSRVGRVGGFFMPKMKTLKYYKKNSHEFAIIERDGLLAIAHGRKVGGSSETWEVIHIQSHDGREIAGKLCEPAEYPPSNEQWGTKGWTFTREDQARARLKVEIGKRERGLESP